MMNGEIWWVDFQEPRGSTPAFVRPLNEIYEEISWVLEN